MQETHQRLDAADGGLVPPPSQSRVLTARVGGGKLVHYEEISSDEELHNLFKELSYSQQRVLMLREPNDTNNQAAERIGLAPQTLSSWLSENGEHYSPVFTRLWYNFKFPENTTLFIERVSSMLAPRQLMRMEDTAALDPRDHPKIARIIHDSRSQILKMPFERADKRGEVERDDALMAMVRNLVRHPDRIALGNVVDTAVVGDKHD